MSGALYVVYAGAALFGIIVAEAIYMLYAGKQDRRAAINRRVKLQEKKISQEQVLIQLRKERGMDGRAFLSMDSLKKLRIQSGITMAMPQFLAITSGVSLAIVGVGYFYGLPLVAAAPLFLALCVVVPLQTLKFRRNRRHKIFGVQLPEALELITRSLKAGHPVPVAIAMVSREMPDPIGSEFGIVADEVTYGSDLVSALRNLYDRVGQEDLPLFVTAVSIQSSSGGNLREILDGLSLTIRDRGKLKRKVRAISTEGRMSAYILTAVPCLLGAAIMVLMPHFYTSVSDEPMTWYMLAGCFVWLMLGNAMMFKMANFKF
jgi:tight adherence protein B